MTHQQKVKFNQLLQAYVAAERRITNVMWYGHITNVMWYGPEEAKSKAAIARQRLQDYVESLICSS
nr:MAG TPA: hypothetical protein [Caudoviricetes sp.]